MKNITLMNYCVLVLFIYCFNNVRCEIGNCNFGTCGECIGSESERCVWCSQDVIEGHRCTPLSYAKTNKTWCDAKHVVDPQPTLSVKQEQNFGEERDGVAVQLKPQLILMKARPGFEIKFDMSFKPAIDFPLDVYYLMDISYTMKKKMADLKNQAKEIYKDLSAYTNNVRLGIGSFVEKPGFPYINPNLHKSHAFKNDVPLTHDMVKFASKIDNIEFGSNFDEPEAGLDALMQAMKCVEEVGWRKGARRIIILCTDSTYHSAGDGKIIGAIKPHDMKCHLKNNTYSEALTYDYPSVSQINQAAADGNFRIIFAITKNENTKTIPETEYKDLTNQIVGSKYAQLEGGKSVIKIIKAAYEELANTIQLNVKAPSFVEVTIDQDCNSEPKRHCESPHKQIVNITGSLKIKSCPGDDNNQINVTINPEGLDEKLIIQLDVDCKCDCEKVKGSIVPGQCYGAGYLQCGICKCNKGRYGADCRCNGSSTDKTDMEKCKFKYGDSKPCSGNGICRCGKCTVCNEGFSGDFCEFNDFSCPKPNGVLCADHGNCRRGQCKCNRLWTGADCSCPVGNENCFAPYSKEVCSGRGTCVCGVCQCDALKGKNETYSGAYCDSCEECAEERCKELENYAYCNYMHKNDKPFCDKNNNGTTTNVFFMNKTEINGRNLYMAKWCRKELDSHNGTYMVFKYQYEKYVLKIIIQDELETPPKANIWVAAGSAIGMVLLIGILTVIVWKILVDLHDKKEYQKFSAEALAQGYDVSQNPLYQDPSINFSNPVYNNQCN